MTDSSGGRESQDPWSNFTKGEENPSSSIILHLPCQSLLGVGRGAKKQKNKESPQQDSKDHC